MPDDDHITTENDRVWEAASAVVLTGLSIYVLACGLWIEVLNERAGRILPRELRPDVNNKWRIAAESVLKRMNAPPEKILQNRQQSRLKSAVEGFGLFQYVLCPAVMLWGGSCLVFLRNPSRMPRICGVVALLAGSTGLYLAVTRQYLASLGW